MKRIFTLILLLTGIAAGAQQYNNEWIKYPQTYYKFKVAAKGLYHIPKSTLDNAGIGSAGAQFFELWKNGKRIPIYTSSSSGPLPSNGYIEFWGEGNDGVPDKVLYRNPAYQHSTELSLLTDTAVYFLSVNTDQSGDFFTDKANDLSGPLPAAEPYFLYKDGAYFNNKINLGFAAVVGEYVYSSAYDKGEFWSSNPIKSSTPLSVTHSNLKVYTSGPNASLRFGVMGDALNPRSAKISLNNSTLLDTVIDYFNEALTTVPVPISLISSGNATVLFENTSAITTDRMVASHFELTYPRLFDFDNKKFFKFNLPASGSGYYLQITNFDYGTTPPVLFDLVTGERITADISTPGMVKLAMGAAPARELVLVNVESANTRTVGSIVSKTFKKFTDAGNQGDYLIITNTALFTGSNGNNPVDEYKNYRRSADGGGYNVQVVDVDELVDQFAFGIKKSPLSIKNFIRYARNNFALPIKNVFLIGRGMTYLDYRNHESDPVSEKLNLVPSFGNPASDNMLSSEDVASPNAVTPIGRLSAVRGSEVEDYLEKVKEYEANQKNAPNTLAGREWMKNIIHVTGASDPYLGTVLCNYMHVYSQIIEDTIYGGNVHTFCKTTTNTVDQLNSEKITQLFEEGLSILTYFGHSSSTTLEFNLDNPQAYNNPGKYPIFFVNGCNAGNFFNFNAQRLSFLPTLSEKFVLAKQRGTIAFVASTHFGIVNYLNIYLDNLYSTISQVDYGKTLGEITRDALKQLITVTGPTDYYARVHAEEITVHGDPALKLNEQAKPDFVIEESQVKINPSFISVAEDNFNVKVRMVNIGKAVNDSITVEVKRQYPDGSFEQLLKQKIRGIRSSDSLSITVPIIASRDKGINKLIITVDADFAIDEMSESNNTVTKEFFIFEDEARPIYPYNYSIINTATSKVVASTANPFSPLRNYVMEMDTTALFSSPIKVNKTLASKGGVLEFDPGITYMDSVVYYWRVAIVPATGEAYHWNNASFIYISGVHEGYNQSHYFQHSKSTVDRISIDSVTRVWKYGSRVTNVFMRNGVFSTGASGENELNVTVDDESHIASACVGHSIVFNVFDPVTFKPWLNIDANGNNLFKSGSGSANCAVLRHYNFEFSYMTPASRLLIMKFMDSIPDNYYVIARSFDTDNNKSYSATWRADTTLYGSYNSLYHRLFAAGMMNIDSINAPRAWIFMYKKNDYSFLPKYEHTIGIYDRGILSAIAHTPDTVGTITSPIFGPSKQWKEVIWRGTSLESPQTDNPTVDVIGINAQNIETVLYTLDRD
ncbi:MAG: C25 family cysteine peptidase, partial [Flavitalea sp.]